MIDQTNFQTWFLMYADNELSAAESVQVEEFVKANPSAQILFDQLCRLKFEPENIVFPDKEMLYADEMEWAAYRFKQDHSITYPFKDALYKTAPVKKFKSATLIRIAASVILILSLFTLLNKNERSVLEQKGRNRQSFTSTTPLQKEKKAIALNGTKNKIVVKILPENKRSYINNEVNIQKDSIPEFIDKVNEADIALSTPILSNGESEISATFDAVAETRDIALSTLILSNEESEINTVSHIAPASNFEASENEYSSVLINTDVFIQDANREQNRLGFRGFVRMISRIVFADEVSEDQSKRIQIANFTIPVSFKL